MASTHLDWFWDQDSLVGELRRGGYGPAEVPRITGFDDIREVRRGGQGIVFSANQRSTKRRVAIKVLLEGAFASKTSRRRFEREIDLVAGLRHPNIVSVHDSGVTADGRLYFVMEFIDGVPLDQFLAQVRQTERAPLSPKEMLRIFAKVGDAINYAHQRGVIHRDLKPGNILVDTAGEPHVCDFGLAKTTSGSAADDPEHHNMSVTGQFMGSLPWASPEQLEGSHTRVDVRTDVYSLGVILYQMLSGRMPFETQGGIRQLFENITNNLPPRPSAVSGNLDDEIDTIVMKCLAKDVERRYQSAAELVADVRHYLAGEPIQAKRDSAWYTLRKTLRRYQVAAGVTAGVIVALLLALLVSVGSWREATRARDAAEKEASQRAAIGTFLERMLTSVDPGRDGRDVRFIEVVDHAASEIGDTIRNQPVVEMQIRRTLGSTYTALGMYEPAEKQMRAAYELARKSHGPQNRATLELLAKLPGLASVQGRMDEAEQEGQRALDEISRALGPTDSLSLSMTERLGDILTMRGKPDEAEALLRKGLAEQKRVLGDRHTDTLSTMNTLAVLLKQGGRYQEAEKLFREIIGSNTAGPHDAGMLTTINNLALVLQVQGKLEESEVMQRSTLKSRQKLLGEEHPDTLVNMSNLATLLMERRRFSEARDLLTQVVDIESRVLGPENPATLTALNNLAKVSQDMGDLEKAEQLFRRSYEGRQRVFGTEHVSTLLTAANLAALLDARGQLDESLKLQREVLEARRRTLGDDHLDTIISKNNLGLQLQKRGKQVEAAILFEEVCQSAARSLSADHYAIGLFRGNYGRCLMALDRLKDAEEQLILACNNLAAAFGPSDPRCGANIKSLIELYESTGRSDEAARWKKKLPTSQPSTRKAAAAS